MKAGQILLTFSLLAFLPVLSGATSFSRMPVSKGFPQSNVSGIAQDMMGDIWITSLDGGIYRYDGTKVQRVDSDIKASGLIIDDKDRVFIGTSNKIFLYDEEKGLKLISSKSGFRDAVVTPSGDVFFCHIVGCQFSRPEQIL